MAVDTLKDAKALQIFTCVLAYDGKRYIINHSSGFERGNVDSLETAGQWLEQMYQKIKTRKSQLSNLTY
jgi:hypothetical protein